jgi:biotin carboxyl carrier protein
LKATFAVTPLLDAIGFPRVRRPSFAGHTPDHAWTLIFTALDNGIIRAPYRLLLQAALRVYEYHPVFRSLAQRYGLLTRDEVRRMRPGRVFLSYRREDTAFPAAWLHERLVGRFGREEVFMEIDSIDLGDDFVEAISTAVSFCDVLVAIIGREWATITDANGHRRLDDPNDFVRLEIETALQREVLVIPTLVEGARLPHAEQLPASLANLLRRQPLELSANRFEHDTKRLLRVIEKRVAERHARQEAAALISTMQGTIVRVTVEEAQIVEPGDPIVVLEAMKMEQSVNAHKAGVVRGLVAEVGQTLSTGAIICDIVD